MGTPRRLSREHALYQALKAFGQVPKSPFDRSSIKLCRRRFDVENLSDHS
jgi:hypothetical protein